MDLALNTLQWLMYHKKKKPKQFLPSALASFEHERNFLCVFNGNKMYQNHLSWFLHAESSPLVNQQKLT